MLTKEFIKKVKEINEDWEIGVVDKGIYIKIGSAYYCSVRTSETYALDTRYENFYEMSESDKENLLKLCVEYASTPIKDREIKLSDVERVILENVKTIKYLARDEDGTLGAFEWIPVKRDRYWEDGNYNDFEINSDLFSFVKWEDEDPTKIRDLLEVD
ncbi:hypothetical protein ACQV2T_04230 [Facklamia sp. P13069]|uniref:hypothetical protein n=1 Tax=Facklamia sp. P13069 TaxID=3421954 RepID=UPI003D16279F